MTDSLFELVAVTLAVAAAAVYCVRSLLAPFSARRSAGCAAKGCGSARTTSTSSRVAPDAGPKLTVGWPTPIRRKLHR